MPNPRVIIILGSKSDLEHGKAIQSALAEFGVASETRIASAHKSPAHLLRVLAEYEAAGGTRLYITVAGRSNALSGFVDAQVAAPVIACPPYSDRFAGGDLFSSLRMPGGVAPAVVLEPAGAALLAVKILGLAEHTLAEQVAARQRAVVETLIRDDAEVRSKGQ
ncbi:MAG: AIR carboxylase family protein [Anaerolineae bacterium]|nr:AIR carboxylase family protein [Anaerolineae bacterium]